MEELRIKEILKQQGKTMQDLADMIGINRVNLSNSLNGNPTLERLRQVADCLNVSIRDLFVDNKTESECKVYGIIRIDDNACIINSKQDLKKLIEDLD